MWRLLARRGPTEAEKHIIVTQQPGLGDRPNEVVSIISSEVVAIDPEGRGLFRGLGSFLRAQPLKSDGAMEWAVDRILGRLRKRAFEIGADGVLNVRVHMIRGVEASGSKLVRISAIGTAVRFVGTDEVEGVEG